MKNILLLSSSILYVVFCLIAFTGVIVVAWESLDNIQKFEDELNEMEKENFVHNLSPNYSSYDNNDF